MKTVIVFFEQYACNARFVYKTEMDEEEFNFFKNYWNNRNMHYPDIFGDEEERRMTEILVQFTHDEEIRNKYKIKSKIWTEIKQGEMINGYCFFIKED